MKGLGPLPAIFLVLAANSAADDYYVDPDIRFPCNDYAPVSRECGSGDEAAFPELAAALSRLAPGDTLYLRGGTYGQVSVPVSGVPAQPIVIRSYPGEKATISGPQVGLWVIGRSDIVLSDLDVVDVEGFGRIEGSTRITVDNVRFKNAAASGTTGSLKFVRSSFNVVRNSRFENGSDLLLLQDDSDRNILINNEFLSAHHSLISIRCSSWNVIRDNDFNNPRQKAMEILDCEGISDAPVRLDDTRGNLIERNRFLGTAPSGQSNDYNAIQHGGQNSIVRHNVFTGNRGGGVNYQFYSDESLFVYNNRLYNNTFYDNACHAIIGQAGRGTRFHGNRVTNNLLYRNTGCRGGRAQTSIANGGQVILRHNTLATSDPGFIDADGGDFRLRADSEQIDDGEFVGRVAASGQGTVIPLDDASMFFDGYGIPSEQGDEVQLESDDMALRVSAIDYSNNTITVHAPVEFRKGQGVHLTFSGSGPDVGAFEYHAMDALGQAPVDSNPAESF